MRYILSFIFLAVVLMFSCKKDDTKKIVIKGKIIDKNQNIPVSGAEITFWASRLQGGTYNPSLIPMASAVSNENGDFQIAYDKDKDASYRITVEKNNYFGITQDIDVDKLPSGNYTYNYEITPEAYLKLVVKNHYPYDNNDFIGYTINPPQPNGVNCCPSSANTGIGYFYENTIKCKTYGAQKVKITWSVKKNNINSLYDSLIYCIPFDTTVFNLNY